jgi:hypothetical protein
MMAKRMAMHPFTELYSRLISLCGLSLRLGGVTVVVGVLAAMCHYSGLWDVAYQATPPLPCSQLLPPAQSNPLLWIERRVLRRSSFSERVLHSCQQAPSRMPMVSVAATPWRLLWNWLSATHPFAHNPLPALRAARWQETRQTLTFLVAYYGANLIALLILLTAGGGVWLVLIGSATVRKGRRAQHTPQLSDRTLRRTPVTVPVPTTSFLTVSLPAPLLRFLASCHTARYLMKVLAAHHTWPASLSHHGAGSGGLLAHTLRAFRLALAHPGAGDPALRQAFLLMALAHDVGKVLAYTPRSSGGFQLTSYYHANRSADLLMAAGLWREFSPTLAESIVTALRSSAASALVPIPENAPPEAARLLGWLSEVDRQAVSEDVADLHARLAQADLRAVLPTLFAAGAPTMELPAPLYREGGTPYLLREPARLVLLTLLQLHEHPGARATTGRKDPVWERLKGVLAELGVTPSEQRLTLSPRPRPFHALALPLALVEGTLPQADALTPVTEEQR